MNYIGPVYALAAALHLLALVILPRPLKKLALVLAVVALPALLGFYFFYFQSAADFPLFYDLQTNYAAALELYQNGGAVYDVPGAYSFPFPTFFIYWVASGFGAWGAAGVFVGFSVLGAAAWLAALGLLWRVAPPIADRETFLFILLAVPAAQAVGQGQTSTFVLLAVCVWWLSLRQARPVLWLLGGAAFALGGMLKPQLAVTLVGLGVVALAVAAERRRVFFSLLGVALGGLAALALTLLLPNGVNGAHYRQFFDEVLPALAPPTTEWKVHGSLAYAASTLAHQVGAPPHTASLAANVVFGGMLLAFAGRTWLWARRGSHRLDHLAALWLAWAVVAPELTWNFYAAWSLPAFMLFATEAQGNKPRLAVVLLCLLLLNVQVGGTPLAVVGVSLLGFLVWTSAATKKVDL